MAQERLNHLMIMQVHKERTVKLVLKSVFNVFVGGSEHCSGIFAKYYTRGRVGNFPCLERQTCPRGRDIESLKCAFAIRIVRVRGVQYSAVT